MGKFSSSKAITKPGKVGTTKIKGFTVNNQGWIEYLKWVGGFACPIRLLGFTV